MDRFNQDTLHFILENAILAPSADNQHRIRFQLVDDTIRVRYTEAELPPQGGYRRVLALLSLGAVLENLTIAASRFGIGTETILLPDPTQPNLIMQIRLQDEQAVVDPLLQFIPLRHTNRRVFFHGPSMSPEDRTTLARVASPFSGCHIHWLDNPELKSQALKLMRMAEGERFRNRLLHKELFSAIHFEVGWQQSCTEGLPHSALGIERPFRHAFALLRHWPVMRLVNLVGGYRILGWRAVDLPSRLAPHLGMIAVDQIDDQTVFAAGRAFQRVWLTITQLGLVLQPIPASAIFSLRGATQEGVPGLLQKRLSQGWEDILPMKHPVMLFRVGRATPPTVTTGRNPLKFYTLGN